jgi:hypothetical protein
MIDTSLLPYAIAVLVIGALATVLALAAIVVVVRDLRSTRTAGAEVRLLVPESRARSSRAA